MHQFFTLYRYQHLYYVLINILKKWYFLALSLLPRQSSMNHTAHHYPLSQNKGVPRAPATRLSPSGTFPRPGCDLAPRQRLWNAILPPLPAEPGPRPPYCSLVQAPPWPTEGCASTSIYKFSLPGHRVYR